MNKCLCEECDGRCICYNCSYIGDCPEVCHCDDMQEGEDDSTGA